ncbi:MAG: CinA family nicotinamide mononucleotide deamidase-related protein [Planctomycetota bacterium]|nr:CinA family nicotinamide mononucleotide deamidase-related protein [Planctomycetota bacterium]
MIAEVISIGDELTSGQRLDTNSRWISQQLGDRGIEVHYHTTVADRMDANVAVFKNAMQRAQIVICNGGLGPTADDLTRKVIAEALNVGLYRCEDSLSHIRNLFRRRNRTMPEQNAIQADFPEGSVPIFNRNGSAPGICLKRENPRPLLLMAFPGVPAELKEMFAETGAREIDEFLGDSRQVILHKPIRCFGIGESDLESRLPDLIRRGRDPQVGITASAATITLRISAQGASAGECETKISETEKVIRDCLGDLVFGTGEDELQTVIHRQLMEKKQTLALAEVGTGGYLSHLLSQVDPDGEVFVGSQVFRNGERTRSFLGGDIPLSETGRHLANRVRNGFAADYAIAVDAFPENEEDLLQIAIATPEETVGLERPFGGHPSIVLPRACKQALNGLRLCLAARQG